MIDTNPDPNLPPDGGYSGHDSYARFAALDGYPNQPEIVAYPMSDLEQVEMNALEAYARTPEDTLPGPLFAPAWWDSGSDENDGVVADAVCGGLGQAWEQVYASQGFIPPPPDEQPDEQGYDYGYGPYSASQNAFHLSAPKPEGQQIQVIVTMSDGTTRKLSGTRQQIQATLRKWQR